MSDRRITFFIALALFAQESTWNFYDNQVPALLREHVASAALVGALMGMDNLLGIFVQPWIGNRSDNTRTRWGRRIPYLAVGMPLAAVIFVLLPWATSLLTLAVVMFCYALIANTTRPLAESLVPDFVAPERRGRTNAAVKIATALTIIVASLISLLVVDDHPRAAFVIPSVIMLAATAVLLTNVRDSRSSAYRAAVAEDAAAGPSPARVPLRQIVTGLITDHDRRRLLLLLTVLLFGGAWFASRSLITPYGMETLGLSRGEAGGLTLPSGIVYVAAAYPAALLAERFGRLRTIAVGMTVFAVALIAGAVVQTATGTVVAFCMASAGAAAYTVNAAVALWNLAPSSQVLGTYTGLYAVTWYLGGFGGPALVGAVVDLVGWDAMLLYIAVLAMIAVLVVVRLGRLQRLHRAVTLTESE
ncbi:MFS family permease [Actinoplanes campanulatus]|uniref:MFS family permease n=1 Tax=Actinoplanes campanulatus TaxID=113559 RepID=A0A7W5AGD2_9ACTN|nr:MFS transporter [Actinoplanes campanulatus]MBB3095803.1 MFS family permease [Actinoplanes campanulatus]GGN11717.1 MFS transporter [Actinoplanes campanulatus]GID37101.1 MFS transporter [Actinoplanes campanulatus]